MLWYGTCICELIIYSGQYISDIHFYKIKNMLVPTNELDRRIQTKLSQCGVFTGATKNWTLQNTMRGLKFQIFSRFNTKSYYLPRQFKFFIALIHQSKTPSRKIEYWPIFMNLHFNTPVYPILNHNPIHCIPFYLATRNIYISITFLPLWSEISLRHT